MKTRRYRYAALPLALLLTGSLLTGCGNWRDDSEDKSKTTTIVDSDLDDDNDVRDDAKEIVTDVEDGVRDIVTDAGDVIEDAGDSAGDALNGDDTSKTTR